MKPAYAILMLLFAAACSKHEPAELPPPATIQKPEIVTSDNITQDAAIETPPDTAIFYNGYVNGHSYCSSEGGGAKTLTVVISFREQAIFFSAMGMFHLAANKFPLNNQGIYKGGGGLYRMVADSLYISFGEGGQCSEEAEFRGKRK
jgi:hypothetical protein